MTSFIETLIVIGVFGSIAIGLYVSSVYVKLGNHVEKWCDAQDEKKRRASS